MSDNLTSSLSRMLGVLGLFNESRLSCSAEEIAGELDVSLPTTYRYIKTLADAGLLQRVEDSRYMLGPRIIVLDHYIRQADPVLREGIPVMAELVAKTGFDCVMSGLFGDQVLDTHREMGQVPAHLSYGRGRPRPLFQGAAPKVILACFPSPQLRKVFNTHREEAMRCGLPAEWDAFRKHFAAIRKAGHYVSVGELEPQLAAVAAPVAKPDGSPCAALSIVTTPARLEVVDMKKLARLVMQAAQQISDRLT